MSRLSSAVSRLSVAIVALLVLVPFPAMSQEGYVPPPGDDWETRSPEDAGLDGDLLQQAIDFAIAQENPAPRDLELNHHMTFGQREPFGDAVGAFKTRGELTGIVVRGGYLVAEWGEPHRVDQTFSVAKSFLSTTVGLAYDRGLISDPNQRVAPDMAPVIAVSQECVHEPAMEARPFPPMGPRVFEPFQSEHNREITWDHLLRQTSDWEGTLWCKPDWADRPASDSGEWLTRERHTPGTVYEYNDTRVNLLGLAATNLWRAPLPQVLKEHVMDPIGASHRWRWHGYDTSWIVLDGREVESVSGGSHWGGGLFISARDLARFGLLTLREGRWGGETILSTEWMEMARTPGEANPGYGHMNYFLNTDRNAIPAAPEEAFFHSGAGSNIVYVDPVHDLVVVVRWIQGGSRNEFIERVLESVVGEPPS